MVIHHIGDDGFGFGLVEAVVMLPTAKGHKIALRAVRLYANEVTCEAAHIKKLAGNLAISHIYYIAILPPL